MEPTDYVARITLPMDFGRFRLLREIGYGGMATVYLAEMVGMEGFRKLVAIKILNRQHPEQDEFAKLFISEARLGGFLSHPNIVETRDFGQQHGRLFLAMEYVEGPTLSPLLYAHREANRSIPPQVALQIMIQVCAGLDHAHHARDNLGRPLKMVHRDLKPSNILISQHGLAKIADFGVARATSNVEHTQLSGMIKGTVRYLSPEQAWGSRMLDQRSDVFGVGIILYETLTLRHLYNGDTPQKIIRAAQDAEIAPALARVPRIPHRDMFLAVLNKALAREPADRFPSARAMGVALDRILARFRRPPPLADWIRSQAIGLRRLSPLAPANANLAEDAPGHEHAPSTGGKAPHEPGHPALDEGKDSTPVPKKSAEPGTSSTPPDELTLPPPEPPVQSLWYSSVWGPGRASKRAGNGGAIRKTVPPRTAKVSGSPIPLATPAPSRAGQESPRPTRRKVSGGSLPGSRGAGKRDADGQGPAARPGLARTSPGKETAKPAAGAVPEAPKPSSTPASTGGTRRPGAPKAGERTGPVLAAPRSPGERVVPAAAAPGKAVEEPPATVSEKVLDKPGKAVEEPRPPPAPTDKGVQPRLNRGPAPGSLFEQQERKTGQPSSRHTVFDIPAPRNRYPQHPLGQQGRQAVLSEQDPDGGGPRVQDVERTGSPHAEPLRPESTEAVRAGMPSRPSPDDRMTRLWSIANVLSTRRSRAEALPDGPETSRTVFELPQERPRGISDDLDWTLAPRRERRETLEAGEERERSRLVPPVSVGMADGPSARPRAARAQLEDEGYWARRPETLRADVAERFERGLLCCKRGEYQGALAEWEEVLALDPENRWIKSNIRRLKTLLEEDVRAHS